MIFVAAQALLDNTEKANGDDTARVHSVILHETETGSAQCFREDAYNSAMGEVDLARASLPLLGDLGAVLPDLLLDDELLPSLAHERRP